MKSSSRVRSGIALFLGIVAVALVGLVGYKIVKNNSTSDANDCGGNRQCFYQAFTDNCSPATIKTTERTIEGDPIVTTAKISQNSEGCSVEITVDGNQDKFGDGKTHTYTCGKLVREDQRLMANDCKDSDDTTTVSI